jgi:TolB-like protein/DNA-binding winged helix-turn-helix (wHTH) protein/Tfp pilus assembly protein PilF
VNDFPPPHSPVRFGIFELDSESGELLKEGLKVRLQEQPFQVLRILLEHPGKVVTRDELQRRIWSADTFVDFDRGLYNAIKKLREALGDDAQKPRFIETLSKRGYRFIGQVQNGTKATALQEAFAPTIVPETGAQETHRRRFVLALGLGTAVLVGLTLMLGLNTGSVRDRLLRRGASPRIQSLAVLPLQNLSGDPTQEYFSDGMTDALITDLSQIGSFKVISRTSSMRYKKTDQSLPEIARELNVDGIVEGTVQRFGDHVRITAQLIHGPSDKHLWANSYERDIHDVFALERDLTQEIASEIQAQLRTPNQARLAPVRPVNAKALEAYLQGSYYLNRFTEEETRKAQEYFQQAIDADPTLAVAYVGMARAHYGLFQGSREDAAIARRAAERALELDPTLSDALVTLGKIKLDSWDWRGMEEEYRKALDVNPSNASAHQELGELLDAMGRLDEGLKECQIAQQLDPSHDHLSGALYDRREFDRSIEVMLLMLHNDPDDVILHHDLYLSYEAKGKYKEAVLHLERTVTLSGFPEVAVNLHHAFAVSGYKGAMREYAKELEHAHATKQIFLPVNLAGVYTTLGDKDRAFYWLEQAYKHSPGTGIHLWMMNSYVALEPLHSDPRFKDLVHRIGLPP